jgi:hypothetical protein
MGKTSRSNPPEKAAKRKEERKEERQEERRAVGAPDNEGGGFLLGLASLVAALQVLAWLVPDEEELDALLTSAERTDVLRTQDWRVIRVSTSPASGRVFVGGALRWHALTAEAAEACARALLLTMCVSTTILRAAAPASAAAAHMSVSWRGLVEGRFHTLLTAPFALRGWGAVVFHCALLHLFGDSAMRLGPNAKVSAEAAAAALKAAGGDAAAAGMVEMPLDVGQATVVYMLGAAAAAVASAAMARGRVRGEVERATLLREVPPNAGLLSLLMAMCALLPRDRLPVLGALHLTGAQLLFGWLSAALFFDSAETQAKYIALQSMLVALVVAYAYAAWIAGPAVVVQNVGSAFESVFNLVGGGEAAE